MVSSIILALGFLAIGIFDFSWRYQAIVFLSAVSIVLSIWSLWEGLTGISWLMTLILPPLYTAGVGMFYFLLPASWLARLPVTVLFAVGMYALLLTQNIFTVASIRTIQLFRSAQAVGFLLALVTAFFAYNSIWSFRLPFWLNGFFVGLVTFPLALHGLWCVKLNESVTRGLLYFSLIISLILLQAGLTLSFWPVSVATGSLFLTAVLYVTLGLCQHYLDDRLYARTIREYLLVGSVVLLTMYLTTSWGG